MMVMMGPITFESWICDDRPPNRNIRFLDLKRLGFGCASAASLAPNFVHASADGPGSWEIVFPNFALPLDPPQVAAS